MILSGWERNPRVEKREIERKKNEREFERRVFELLLMMKTLNTRLYVNTDHLWMRCENFVVAICLRLDDTL